MPKRLFLYMKSINKKRAKLSALLYPMGTQRRGHLVLQTAQTLGHNRLNRGGILFGSKSPLLTNSQYAQRSQARPSSGFSSFWLSASLVGDFLSRILSSKKEPNKTKPTSISVLLFYEYTPTKNNVKTCLDINCFSGSRFPVGNLVFFVVRVFFSDVCVI